MGRTHSIPDQSLPQANHSILIRPVLKQINKRTLNDKAHRHLFQEIIYIKSGHGSHFIDDKTIQLRPRCFYLIGVNQVHGFNYGEDLDGVLIRFNEDFVPVSSENASIFRDYVNTLLLKNELQLSKKEAKSFEMLLDLLLEEYSNESSARTLTLQNLLLALLNKITSLLLTNLDTENDSLKDRDRQIYNRFHILSSSHFNKEHQLSFYARRLGISARRLSDICLKFSGKTAKTIISDKIMSEIKRQLNYTALSHKEIAYRMGFEDPAYMARLFKKNTGKTMSQYRQSKQSS